MTQWLVKWRLIRFCWSLNQHDVSEFRKSQFRALFTWIPLIRSLGWFHTQNYLLLESDDACVLHKVRNHRTTQCLIFNTSHQCCQAEKLLRAFSAVTKQYDAFPQTVLLSFFFSRWSVRQPVLVPFSGSEVKMTEEKTWKQSVSGEFSFFSRILTFSSAKWRMCLKD